MIEIDDVTHNFIRQHLDDDVAKLALQRSSFSGSINFSFAFNQIEGIRKGRIKFPSLSRYEGFIYPPAISMEQCSSEHTAKYKADLLKSLSIADITGGLGIDTIFVSEKAAAVHYIEQNKELYEVARHNFEVCKRTNITPVCDDGVAFLERCAIHFDCIYLDPARRDMHNRKIVSLADCTPNILSIKPLLFAKAAWVLLKASPMLDINKALHELENVFQVHVLAVKNECKELLFCINEKTEGGSLEIICTNILANNKLEVFSFLQNEENEAHVRYADTVGQYLYEPNSTILKAGGFRVVADRFGLKKLHIHSHLYTSERIIENFPGKIFEIKAVFPLSEKEIKMNLPERKANIVTRNYPLSPDEIKKKFHLSDGDTETFLFATTMAGNKKAGILCQRKQKK